MFVPDYQWDCLVFFVINYNFPHACLCNLVVCKVHLSVLIISESKYSRLYIKNFFVCPLRFPNLLFKFWVDNDWLDKYLFSFTYPLEHIFLKIYNENFNIWLGINSLSLVVVDHEKANPPPPIIMLVVEVILNPDDCKVAVYL